MNAMTLIKDITVKNIVLNLSCQDKQHTFHLIKLEDKYVVVELDDIIKKQALKNPGMFWNEKAYEKRLYEIDYLFKYVYPTLNELIYQEFNTDAVLTAINNLDASTSKSSFIQLCEETVCKLTNRMKITVDGAIPDVICNAINSFYNEVKTHFMLDGRVKLGGAPKSKPRRNTYTRTKRKHTDIKGITRVVYTKNNKMYVKVKKDSKFVYKLVKV